MSNESEPEETAGTGESDELFQWLELRGINVFLTVVIGLAVIGFFVGTTGDPFDAQLAGFSDEPDDQVADDEAMPARSYTELMENPYVNNDHWRTELQRLSEQRPAQTEEVERTPEMTARALDERQQHRAYAGAPPTIPHPVAETGSPACMACHGEGLRVDNRLAPPISHEERPNCTQCHVPANTNIPAEDTRRDELPLNNNFDGLDRWGPGDRAQPGAPPTIPHPTNMRGECSSCHGTMARPGLRTTHPWRIQCTQCHAPSATLDQRPTMQLPDIVREESR